MRRVSLEVIESQLPDDLATLQAAAQAERFHAVARLLDEWTRGVQRFDQSGECLMIARHRTTLVAIGGRTLEPALPGAVRMRRFYVHPDHRRQGIGRALALALLAEPQARATIVTVNAATELAPHFWEALGFRHAPQHGYTHRLDPPPQAASTATIR